MILVLGSQDLEIVGGAPSQEAWLLSHVRPFDLSGGDTGGMSRWLGKQGSVESPGVGRTARQERRAVEEEGKSHRAKLNRSLTISSQPATPATASRDARDPTSPLKRFAQAKAAIRRAFQHLGERLVESQAFLQAAQLGGDGEGVASLTQRTQEIQKVLNRDRMKVAFFGRTSNGKSSVINALLHGRVLPVGIGHTTNCFCSVVGAEGSEGYLLTAESSERRSIKSLQQLAHSLSSQHLDPSALVRIFWPQTKCPLLAEDVEFVDSPGVDMNANIDEWITKHCLDADVFVLVSNAESTLMNAEKSFFHRVSERISKPNVFILNNRWDASDSTDIAEEEEEAQGAGLMEQVMQQHLERDVKFLAEELCVTDERTARHRVFFVSAKEVLQYRLRRHQSQADPVQGLAPGFRVRLQSFEEFERRLKECLSSSAISTKFEQHYKQGLAVVEELDQLLTHQDSLLHQKREAVEEELAVCQARSQELDSRRPTLIASGDQLVSVAMENVSTSLSKAVRDLLSQLPTLVDQYEASFDPNDLAQYKEGLFAHFEEQLSAELERASAAAVAGKYEDTWARLIEAHQQLLELGGAELERAAPVVKLSYSVQAAELCQDFQEDLQFRFSLGFNTLSSMASTGSWLAQLRNRLSIISSVVSVEYAVPVVLATTVLLLPRFLHWRYLLPVVCVCGGLYSYEWLAWTPRSQEAALKRQFVEHVREKVQLQVKAVNNSCVFQMQANLQSLRSRLLQQLEACKEKANVRAQQLARDQVSLSMLSGRLKVLRNAMQLSVSDLKRFREDFLDQVLVQ